MPNTMPKPGKYDHREPVRAMQFGPSYREAFDCYEWVRAMGANVNTDGYLEHLRIGPSLETEIGVKYGDWVVWEDDRFWVYSEQTFKAKFKEAPPNFVFIDCTHHTPVQHRDGKEPWCGRCGKNSWGRTPSVGNTNLIHQKND